MTKAQATERRSTQLLLWQTWSCISGGKFRHHYLLQATVHVSRGALHTTTWAVSPQSAVGGRVAQHVTDFVAENFWYIAKGMQNAEFDGTSAALISNEAKQEFANARVHNARTLLAAVASSLVAPA
jgi:hypothetical protein